MQDYNY